MRRLGLSIILQPPLPLQAARKIYFQGLQPDLYIEGDTRQLCYDVLVGDIRSKPFKLAKVNKFLLEKWREIHLDIEVTVLPDEDYRRDDGENLRGETPGDLGGHFLHVGRCKEKKLLTFRTRRIFLRNVDYAFIVIVDHLVSLLNDHQEQK